MKSLWSKEARDEIVQRGGRIRSGCDGGRAASALAGVAALLVAVAAAVLPARGSDDPWQELRPLLGTWEGTGSGFGGTSAVSHEWQFVLDGKFLRLRTRSVATGEDGSEEHTRTSGT